MTDMLNATLEVNRVRDRFASLRDGGFAFFDAPGGSQVPDEVGEAIARALQEASANLGAGYATSRRVGEILATAEAGAARFLGCDPHEITFGSNMTSLNFTLSRTAGRDLAAGDEILVSAADHDGGVAPWLELAHDRDLLVRTVEVHDDTTLDFDDLAAKLSERTRVVAFAWASNAVGTVVDAARVCRMAHEAGALAWVDAVHYAAHEPIDVRAIGADVLICSPYKFCGPHLGMAYGRAEVTERWRPYKARPAAMDPLGRRFETGTQPYELLAGLNATFAYLESIGGFEAIAPYERALGERFLAGLSDRVTVYGLPGMPGRVPTFLVNVDGVPAAAMAAALAEQAIGVWAHDHWYSLGLYRRLGYEHDAIRIGLIHYNTPEEVDRLVAALERAAEERVCRDPPRSFLTPLARPGLSIIAEHKRSSPSAGVIRDDLALEDVVVAYEQGGAAAVSVLTESHSFSGSLDDLRRARAAARLPILRKDFIVDPYQVVESLAAGADAILLIVAALTAPALQELDAQARGLGLGVLVEVHDSGELEVAAQLGAPLIGVNNRNLTTLRVDTHTTFELLDRMPQGATVVSESGWRTRADLDRLRAAGVDAVLIGEALMRADDIGSACRALAAS